MKKMPKMFSTSELNPENDNIMQHHTTIDENALLQDYYGYLQRNRNNEVINRNISFWKTILAWFLLIISTIGGASVGPFFLFINTQSKSLKAAWRFWMTCILLIPFILREYLKDKEKLNFNSKVLLKHSALKNLILASLANSISLCALVYAINYTTIAQIYLLNNLQFVAVVIYKYFARYQNKIDMNDI